MIETLLYKLELFGSTQQGIHSNPEKWTAWIEYLQLLTDDFRVAQRLCNSTFIDERMKGIQRLHQIIKDIEEAFKIAQFASALKHYPTEKSWTAEETLYFLFKSFFNKKKYPNPEDFEVEIYIVFPNGSFGRRIAKPSFNDMKEYVETHNISNEEFVDWMKVSYSIIENKNDN